MPTNTVLIPGATVEGASEVLKKLKYKHTHTDLNDTKYFSRDKISVTIFPERNIKVDKIYYLVKKDKPNLEDGIVLELREENKEGVFSYEIVQALGALIRSISPNKKYMPSIEDGSAPISLEGCLWDIVKKKRIQIGDLAKIFYA